MHSRFFVAALLSFGLIGSAAAHSIWVEREGDGARIYFGEFDENLREASPGLLDRLKPEAKVAGSDKALKVDKQAGFFAVAGPWARTTASSPRTSPSRSVAATSPPRC